MRHLKAKPDFRNLPSTTFALKRTVINIGAKWFKNELPYTLFRFVISLKADFFTFYKNYRSRIELAA